MSDVVARVKGHIEPNQNQMRAMENIKKPQIGRRILDKAQKFGAVKPERMRVDASGTTKASSVGSKTREAVFGSEPLGDLGRTASFAQSFSLLRLVGRWQFDLRSEGLQAILNFEASISRQHSAGLNSIFCRLKVDSSILASIQTEEMM